MKTAEFLPNMNYIHWHGKPNEFGDTHFSGGCLSTKEARKTVKDSGVTQNLFVCINGKRKLL